MSEHLETLRRNARPDHLASLRGLERTLERAGWRYQGKTPREWLRELLQLEPAADAPDPLGMLIEVGLAAVPGLVDTLRTRVLAPRGKDDTLLRAQCVRALGHIEPAPTCAIPVLLEMLHQPSSTLRALTLWVLARLQPQPSSLAVRELLACLHRKHEPKVRVQAARALSRLHAPLPAEVRQEALSRLADPDARVRCHALRILERLPGPDPEVRTALEEQTVLDDANLLEALRVLMRFDPPRALELLAEELQRAARTPWDRPQAQRGEQALYLVSCLGARAAPLLPVLRCFEGTNLAAAPLEIAIDAIVREQLFAQRPTPAVPPHPEERVRQLLAPGPAPAPGESEERALARWAVSLLPLGRELCVRVALAAARRVAGLWEAAYFLLSSPRDALFGLEEWVCTPDEETARRAVQRGNLIPSQLCDPAAFSATWTATFATLCILTDAQHAQWAAHTQPLNVEGGFLGTTLYSACRALQGSSVITFALGALGGGDELPRLSAPAAVRELRAAIVEEVLPWLLGTWDPVTEVCQRRRELYKPPVRLPNPYPP